MPISFNTRGRARHTVMIPGWLLLLALPLLLSSSSAWASITVALTLEDLALASDEVVLGEVVAEQTEPAGGMIITRYTFRVVQNVAGRTQPPQDIEIVAAGGEYNGLGVLVHGSPRLHIGQRYLLFLRQRRDHFSIVGLAQGALRVTTDASGDLLVHPAQGLARLTTLGGGVDGPGTPALTFRAPLSEVVSRIVEARHGL